MSLVAVQTQGGRGGSQHSMTAGTIYALMLAKVTPLIRKAGLLKPGHHLRTLLALGLTRREGGPGTIGPPLTGHCHGGWRVVGRFVEGRLKRNHRPHPSLKADSPVFNPVEAEA